jgi:amino acid transporter
MAEAASIQNAGEATVASVVVEARSHGLQKELGLFDLVLAQTLLIFVPDYFGTAIKAGDAHVAFWVAGTLLFFLPLAAVVMHMNRRLPLEGGLYEWARIAFGDQLGFLVAWNMWMYGIVYVGLAGLVTAVFVSYAIPGWGWIASNKAAQAAFSVGMVGMTVLVARVGLNIGKWIFNLASATFLGTVLLLIVSPFVHVWRGTMTSYHPLHVVAPSLTLFSVSVFSKMTFGALTGFEYVATLAGECRNPRRDLPWSVLLTAPVIALTYILTTSAIRAFVPSSGEDVVAPIAQAFSRGGAQVFGLAGVILPLAIVILFFYYLATFCIFFGVCTRLPMVAGWDHLLPQWFSNLHPKYKTPTNSIVVLGVATLLFGLGASLGVRTDEAVQTLLTCSFTFYALAYLALFAIPLFSAERKGLRPSAWVRAAAWSGFLATLLFIVLSVVPIIHIGSEARYSLKIVAVVVGANLAAVAYYQVKGKREVEMAGAE